MTRYTTFKLKNIATYEPIFSLAHSNTSESILSQDNKDVPYITDQFKVIKMQIVAHSWLSKEEHARKVLCQITKSDYELISFKKMRLDDIINKRNIVFLPF